MDQLKAIVLGPVGCGKSALIHKFIGNAWKANRPSTQGVEFSSKVIEVAGKEAVLQLWDVSGKETSQNAMASFLPYTLGVLLVYDITRSESIAGLSSWVGSVKQNAKDPSELIFYLVGNKRDRGPSQVTETQRRDFAEQHGCKVFELSALTGETVTEMFEELAADLSRQQQILEQRHKDHEQRLQLSRGEKNDDIHMAIREGNLVMLERCLSSGQANQRSLTTGGMTPLMTAAYFGKKEVIRLLAESGAVVDAIDNISGDTACHYCALSVVGPVKQCSTIMALAEVGADITIPNFDQLTAADIAARDGNLEFADAFSEAL